MNGQVENLTFEEYLRGVFEINNGIENDPDNLVRIHAPELLKLARKQEQPEVDLEKEIGRWMDKLDDKYCMFVENYSIQDIKDTAHHFWNKGYNVRKEETKWNGGDIFLMKDYQRDVDYFQPVYLVPHIAKGKSYTRKRFSAMIKRKKQRKLLSK